jgi:hypothetical protein
MPYSTQTDQPLLREPYKTELQYFKANPSVTGMMTSDEKVILNPFSNLSKQEQNAVYQNEAIRLHLKKNNYEPKFELTPQQREFFKGTPYEKDETAAKHSILARILTGDPSVGTLTKEQKSAAESIAQEVNKPTEDKQKAAKAANTFVDAL